MLSNVSFQIPIGITFLTLILWKVLENRKRLLKEKGILPKKMFIVLIISLPLALILGIVFYQYQPIKPLEKIGGLSYLTNYTYNIFSIFDQNIKYVNRSCLTSFISVFPMGLVIGIWYILKEENEHFDFLTSTVIISILELIWIVSNKMIVFLPNYIFVLGFHLLQIYMLLYIFSRIEKPLFNLTKAAYVTLIGLLLLLLMPVPKKIGYIALNLSYIVFVLEAYMVLNYSDKRFWRLASWVFTVICLFDFVGYTIVNFM